jgi:hypothetical protein
MISMKSYILLLSTILCNVYFLLVLSEVFLLASRSCVSMEVFESFREFSLSMAYDVTTMTWVSGYIIAENSMCQYVKYVKYVTTS